MPSAYAHFVFGKKVLRMLPASIQRKVKWEQDAFLTGLQGPDILFYYRPLVPNTVKSLGLRIHYEPASLFLKRARKILLLHGSTARIAYIVGFLCHFMLDSECHPYIAGKIKSSGLSHTEIESEFDRWLMQRSGRDPLRYSAAGHLRPSLELGQVIAPFYPPLSPGKIARSMRSMKFWNEFLLAGGLPKRTLLYGALHAAGFYESHHSLIKSRRANPQCFESNRTLNHLLNNAAAPAANQIVRFFEAVRLSKPFDRRLDRNFE